MQEYLKKLKSVSCLRLNVPLVTWIPRTVPEIYNIRQRVGERQSVISSLKNVHLLYFTSSLRNIC